MKKYKFTGETRQAGAGTGITVRRIRAVESFGGIKAGELGGWIESEANLSHGGDAWVGNNAEVTGNALVGDNAMVCDNARVSGDVKVTGNALIYGNAHVRDNAVLYGNAWVGDNAIVCANAQVGGNAFVRNNAFIGGNALVCNDSVSGNTFVGGNARLCGNEPVGDEKQWKTDFINDCKKNGITISRDMFEKVEQLNLTTQKNHSLLDITEAFKTGVYVNNPDVQGLVTEIGQYFQTQQIMAMTAPVMG